MIRNGIVWGMFIVIGFVALGCKVLGPQVEAREAFSYSKPASQKRELVLDNINGDIVITGVDDLTAVEITGTKIVKAPTAAAAREHLGDITIDVAALDTTIEVSTDQPDGGMGRSYHVSYQIKVPSTWTVRVENVNGNVQVVGMKSAVETSITNGNFQARSLAGNIDVDLANGAIEGDMKLPENGMCSLSTTNGTIDAKMEIPASAEAQLEATNGRIALAIPRSTSANLSAESSVGSVDVSNLQLDGLEHDRDGIMGESISGTLGSGSATIDLEVTNGEIAVSGY
jgi:DUF4097 and DUF4098 domain-containing protein YvlB